MRYALFLSAGFCFLVLTMAFAVPARAQWLVHVQGPDVFGNTTVVAGATAGNGDDVVVQCDQNNLYIADIGPGTPKEMDELSGVSGGIPATLYLKVDQQPVQTFDARLQQWNNSMLGVVASGRSAAMLAMLQAIGAGTETLDVGTDVLGTRQSDSFGLEGSTNAMNTVIKDCKLQAPATER